MQWSGLVLMMVVVAGCEACTYFCKTTDGTSYECCDHLYLTYLDDEDNNTPTSKSTTATTQQSSSHCYYYCVYDGHVYCCGDDSRPIPANHDPHPGKCAEEADQVCKSSGIYLLTKKVKVGKTVGSLQLATEEGKQLDSCASDGYCKQEEKCCPSKCARKHVCLKSLKQEEEEED